MYPPGGGGHWFMNTLSRLILGAPGRAMKNYHGSKIFPIHYDDHWVIRSRESSMFFGDSCIFNFYINYVEKIDLMQDITNKDANPYIALFSVLDKIFPWYDEFEEMHTHPGYVHYKNLWQTDLFLKEFENACVNAFGDLANNTKLRTQALMFAIDEYKSTLPDINDHYDNLESTVWVAWCMYIALHYKLINNIPIDILTGDPDFSITQIKQIYPKIISLTQDKIYFYPES